MRTVLSWGAFVNIAEGVDGLVHISRVSDDRVEDLEAMLSPGDKVQVRVVEVDLEKATFALAMNTYRDPSTLPPRRARDDGDGESAAARSASDPDAKFGGQRKPKRRDPGDDIWDNTDDFVWKDVLEKAENEDDVVGLRRRREGRAVAHVEFCRSCIYLRGSPSPLRKCSQMELRRRRRALPRLEAPLYGAAIVRRMPLASTPLRGRRSKRRGEEVPFTRTRGATAPASRARRASQDFSIPTHPRRTCRAVVHGLAEPRRAWRRRPTCRAPSRKSTSPEREFIILAENASRHGQCSAQQRLRLLRSA